jgi:ankyrin repeat protein
MRTPGDAKGDAKEWRCLMSEQSDRVPTSLPDAANLEWLRKQAKRMLAELRKKEKKARLADAQFALAQEHGFPSWRALKAHFDSLTLDGQLFDAARKGKTATLKSLLAKHPERLHAKAPPYEHTLLHAAAQHGHLDTVNFLLDRGMNPNVKEKGDNTYPMHWAAAAGNLPIVKRLADAGGDVAAEGDDHALGLIGWATGWDGQDLATRRAIADFLVSRGAKHNIYSAVALDDPELVRAVVAQNPAALKQPLSHNEDFQLPLHFAVRKELPRMVEVLLELGADPLGRDASGYLASVETHRHDIDRPVLEALARAGKMDLFTAVSLRDWSAAERLRENDPSFIDNGRKGALHVASKRGDVEAVKWLLDHGANPNALWPHWDADVTPLHMAAWGGHADVADVLLRAGADPAIKDSKHDSDALGWAEFFGRLPVVHLLQKRR